MELIIYRIVAAVGIVTIVSMIEVVSMGVIERLRDRAKRKKLKRAGHGYAIRNGSTWYIADARELKKARRIIKMDKYGLWKTESGMFGPWEQMNGEWHD